ncbi:hypothetical protein COCNU_04G009390 [Cocos nucifera]|uniref:Uncharacterized protein n=1 Tax=Cocos nucifera TaxID=13894 RepID=A0A8K0I609_COCNU|nr:hypothetical protein COCNU_04G009390 [Cocos nucifera]
MPKIASKPYSCAPYMKAAAASCTHSPLPHPIPIKKQSLVEISPPSYHFGCPNGEIRQDCRAYGNDGIAQADFVEEKSSQRGKERRLGSAPS